MDYAVEKTVTNKYRGNNDNNLIKHFTIKEL